MSRRSPQKPDVEWVFFSAPVAFALSGGALLAVFFVEAGFDFIIFPVSLFGLSFTTAHMLAHSMRRRSQGRGRQRADEEERERRALAARQAASLQNEASSTKRRRRRRRPHSSTPENPTTPTEP